jgi:thiamine biosynthesis lipoprotein
LWSSCVINVGGNVSTFGYKNDDGQTLWNIGVENPDTTSSDYLMNVNITDLSVVTSGDYQRYFTVDGKKYCHIIDTDTLMPSEYFSSVTVICSDSALGDALSTTLFNMPLDEGQALVDSLDNVEAVWVDKDYNQTYSTGFEQYIKNQ